MPTTNPHFITHQASQTLSIGLLPSSPIGPLWVAASSSGLLAVDWNQTQSEFSTLLFRRLHLPVVYDQQLTAEPLQQLSEYLHGNRRQFDLALDLPGMSPFQVQVLLLTQTVAYGQTTTYKCIAERLGNPRAARAVGRVEATNPIPLVVPCHRVLGSDGSLHGYGGPGGVRLKAWLLALEQAH